MDPKRRYIPGQNYFVPQKGEMRFIGFDDEGHLVFKVNSGTETYVYNPNQEIAGYKRDPAKKATSKGS
jgi:hypothetical protein